MSLWKKITNDPLKRARFSLLLLLAISSFFFIRIYSATPVFMVPSGGDDGGYFVYTDAFFRTGTFNWCDKSLSTTWFYDTCENNKIDPTKTPPAYNMYTPGPFVVLFPFNLFGWTLHKVGIFTPKAVDPLVFWSIVGTFLLFLLGTLCLFESVLFFLPNIQTAWWVTVLYIIGNPILYFVFRRPILSHSAEFFIFFAALYALIRVNVVKKSILSALVLGGLAGLMVITRINNVHVPAIIGILLLFWQGPSWAKERYSKVFFFLLGTVPPLFFFLWMNYIQKGTFLYSTQNYYSEYTIGFFLRFYWVNISRMFLWFVGPHWGLAWLSPIFLFQCYIFAKYGGKIISQYRKSNLPALAMIGGVILVHLNLLANGPTTFSYSYRYLFTHYYFVFVMALLVLGKFAPKYELSRKVKIFGVVAAVIASAHIINFESNATDLTLTTMPVRSEGVLHPFWVDTPTMAAPYYVLHSYKHLLTGKAILNLGASPILAYPILALDGAGFGSLPGLSKALDYYKSEKRQIASFSDLFLLAEYQVIFFLGAVLSFLVVMGLKPLRSVKDQ